MNKKSSLWIILAVIVAACPSLFCCSFGAITLAGGGTYEMGTQSGQLPPSMGLVFLCLGLLPWLIVGGIWLFVQRRNNNTL